MLFSQPGVCVATDSGVVGIASTGATVAVILALWLIIRCCLLAPPELVPEARERLIRCVRPRRKPLVSDHVAVTSQINGLNGEATGTDDLAEHCEHPYCNGVFVRISNSDCRYYFYHMGNETVVDLSNGRHNLMCHFCVDETACDAETTDDCYCGLCLLRILHGFHNDHQVASSLNGAHGEFTGSDDVKGPAAESRPFKKDKRMPPTSSPGDRLKSTSGIDAAIVQLPEPSAECVVEPNVVIEVSDCKHWLEGTCNRHHCRFLHDPAKRGTPPVRTPDAVPVLRDAPEEKVIDPYDLSNVVLGSRPSPKPSVYRALSLAFRASTLVTILVHLSIRAPGVPRRHEDLLFNEIILSYFNFSNWMSDTRVTLLFITWSICFTIAYVTFRKFSKVKNRAELIHTLYESVPRYVESLNWLPIVDQQNRAGDLLYRRGLTEDVRALVHTELVDFLVKKYRRSNIEAHLPNSWYKSIEDYMKVLPIEVVNNSVRRAHQILYSQHLQDVEMGLYFGRAAVPTGRPN